MFMVQKSNKDELRIARAVALEAYASVESALVVLLARLLNTTNDLAAIVFFRITNTAARNGIIENLLTKIYEDKYDVYWRGQSGGGSQKRVPGLFALIQQLDTRRNELVHWHPTSHSSSSGERWTDLRPAYYWARAPHLNPIKEDELNAFAEKAKFAQKSIFYFTQFISKPPDVFENAYGHPLETWTQIFQQPIPYPPSSDHPLAPKPKGRPAPDQSSQV
jgi:hypothetical protein